MLSPSISLIYRINSEAVGNSEVPSEDFLGLSIVPTQRHSCVRIECRVGTKAAHSSKRQNDSHTLLGLQSSPMAFPSCFEDCTLVWCFSFSSFRSIRSRLRLSPFSASSCRNILCMFHSGLMPVSHKQK